MFNKLLSLQTRPFSRKVYVKAALILWALSIGLAILLGVLSGILWGLRIVPEDVTYDISKILIYIFSVIFLYRITLLRIQDAGDNKNLAWLTIVPFVNFIVVLIYFFRPSAASAPAA